VPINRLPLDPSNQRSEDYESLQYRIIKRTLVILIFAFMFSLILKRPFVSLGLVFGVLVSILVFRLLAKDIQTLFKIDPKKAIAFTQSHFIFRYTLLALALTLAIILGKRELLFATFIGLLLIKIAIYSIYPPKFYGKP